MSSTKLPTTAPILPHRGGLTKPLDRDAAALQSQINALADRRAALAAIAPIPKKRLVAERDAIAAAKDEVTLRRKIGEFLAAQRSAAIEAADQEFERAGQLHRQTVDALLSIGFAAEDRPRIEGMASQHPAVRDSRVKHDSLRAFAGDTTAAAHNAAGIAALATWLDEFDLEIPA